MELITIEKIQSLKLRELYALRRNILNEFDRRNRKEKTKRQLQDGLKEYGKKLVNFIEQKKDICLCNPSKKQNQVVTRMILFTHLYGKKMSLTNIGKLFNRDHASIIHGLSLYKNYSDARDEMFIKCNSEIQELINEYNAI